MRDLGQEISDPGVRHQPVPEPSRSSAPRQLHERWPLLNLSQRTFRAWLPALNLLPGPPGAQGDSQRPLPPPRFACPVSIHSVRPLAQPFGEPLASAALCGTSGRLGSAVPVPGHQARDGPDSEQEGEPRTSPRTHLPTLAPSLVRKSPGRRGAVFPARQRSGSPTSRSPRTFRALSQKRK